MTDPRGFPGWEERYRTGDVETMPWYWPALDRDLDAALARHGVAPGRLLDLGTGPGTQAIALAQRGFQVTATDLASSALAYANRKAKEQNVNVTFVQDDILASKLTGPFELIIDRGCFHVIAPEQRSIYVDAIHRMLVPSGWLFLKTLSHLQPVDLGPHRFRPEDIRRQFDRSRGLDVVEILDTDFQGQLEEYPKALFAAIRAV